MNQTIRKAEAIDSKTMILARRLSALRKKETGRFRVAVPDDLRGEILAAWRESGQGKEQFGRRVGVTGTSLTNWIRAGGKVRAATKPGRARRAPVAVPAARPGRGKFREVRVLPESVAKVPSASAGRSFVLELGYGARIGGLEIEDVVRLMNAAGSRQ